MTAISRSIYKIDGAKWELVRVSKKKWILYRMYKDYSKGTFGTFPSKKSAIDFLAEITGLLP